MQSAFVSGCGFTEERSSVQSRYCPVHFLSDKAKWDVG